MNSFINNIDKKEKIVVVFVLLCLMFIEVTIRAFETDMSGNIKHMYEISAIAKSLGGGENKEVVFIGNSLINEAIDKDVIKNTLSKKGLKNYEVVKITPDATSLWDWYFIYKNHIFKNNTNLDFVISGFAWGQLADQNRVYPSRLAGYFCNFSDIFDLMEFGMGDSADILEFIVAKISQVYVNREAIRKRSLDMIVPGYREISQYINNTASTKEKNQQIKKIKYSYKKLELLLKKAKQNKLKLIFVAMPVVTPYMVDESLRIMLEKYGMKLIDFRFNHEIKREMFEDYIHLGDEGAKVFSKILMDNLIINENMFTQ